jgi:hypothetical protein
VNAPRGIGEQWMPVPVRLVEAIQTAPTARRRVWAVAYLVIWVLTFHRTQRGQECSIRDLEAWSGNSTRTRTTRSKADALAVLEQWNGLGTPMERKQNSAAGVETLVSDSNGTEEEQQQNDRARLPLQAHSTIHNSPLKSPQGDLELFDDRLPGVPPADHGGPLGDADGDPAAPPAGDVLSAGGHVAGDVHDPGASERGADVDCPGARGEAPADVWKQINALRSEAGQRPWKLTGSRRKALTARLKESSPAEVLTVFRWFINSPDAQWQRDNWKKPADTLLRPSNFQGYLEHAEEQRTASKDMRTAPDDVWAVIQDALLDARSAMSTPGPGRAWRLFPDDDDLETAVLDAIQTATSTSSHGFAWQALRRTRKPFDQRKLLRDFNAALTARRAA